MATSTKQRISILIIALVMAVGTIGSFAVMVLANKNAAIDQKRIDELTKQYEAEAEVYQGKVDAQAAELSGQYYPIFGQYAGRVSVFDGANVTEVTTEDLLEGSGETIGDDTVYSAYYIGWTPEGKIFDQSIENDALKSPIAGENLIPGWSEGVKGMKIGGVREITIPSDKAYGETGYGEEIAPGTPLTFVVMAVPRPAEIPQPQYPQELLDYYGIRG